MYMHISANISIHNHMYLYWATHEFLLVCSILTYYHIIHFSFFFLSLNFHYNSEKIFHHPPSLACLIPVDIFKSIRIVNPYLMGSMLIYSFFFFYSFHSFTKLLSSVLIFSIPSSEVVSYICNRVQLFCHILHSILVFFSLLNYYLKNFEY